MNAKCKNPTMRKRVGSLGTVGNVLTEMARVYREGRRGEITTADAGRFMAMLTLIRQAIEGEELERRVTELEEGTA